MAKQVSTVKVQGPKNAPRGMASSEVLKLSLEVASRGSMGEKLFGTSQGVCL
ncbi:hypothetical protein CsSME_00003739 [Camellia sinensis var. sinensis]